MSDNDSRNVYIERTNLFSVNGHVVPGSPLLIILDGSLDMWLEVADVL